MFGYEVWPSTLSIVPTYYFDLSIITRNEALGGSELQNRPKLSHVHTRPGPGIIEQREIARATCTRGRPYFSHK